MELMTGEKTIASILESRGAFLKGQPGCEETARRHEPLLKVIEHNYPLFEPLRDQLMTRQGVVPEMVSDHEALMELLDHLRAQEIVRLSEEGRLVAADAAARRFLSGGWLEELAWLAAMAAGADEAIYSQVLGWRVGEFYGENEIDLIVRKAERLGFVSCKALQSEFNAESKKHRARLMDALHEADNLCDHFGREGERVGILVTTDLIDEVRDQPRYMALMGKAAVLDVRIIPLEELEWNSLVSAIGEIVHGRDDG